MPSLPLSLTATRSVTLPLEAAYLSAWVSFPKFLRERLEFPASGGA